MESEKDMKIIIEMSDDIDRTEMHKLTTAIEFMIWNNGVKIVKSITEKVE